MIAAGLTIFVFAILLEKIIPVHPHKWDWRDLFSTLPAIVGLLMMLAGLIRWLWLVAP